MSKNVYMVPLISGGIKDKSITTNGRDFKANKLFMLICNHPIGKREKVYFEFTIKDYKDMAAIKYYPLYAGVHKEASTGTLSNDFCIGSLFFSVVSGKYSVLEKYRRTESTKNSDPGKASFRPPAVDEIVGVAIDLWENKITFYVEGRKLYTFSPSLFNMKDENGEFYAVIYSSIPAQFVGYVNFGKNGCKYTPPGYLTMWQAHNKSAEEATITGKIYVEQSIKPRISAEISGFVGVRQIKNAGSIVLEKTHKDDIITKDVNFELGKNNGVLYSSLPVPSTHKIYTEIYVRDAINVFKTLGIPIAVGVTDKPEDIRNGHSMELPMHHKMNYQYDYIEHNMNSSYRHVIDNVLTSVPNEEGKTIGIGTDLKNGLIHVWINKILFYTYKIQTFKAINNFRLFIKDDGSFTNVAKGYVNFGASEEYEPEINPFKMNIPEGYMSLWHYYNRLNKYLVPNTPEIVGELEVEDKYTRFSRYISGQVTVDEHEMTKTFRSGLNRLMSTYNIVTDIEDPGNPDYNEDHYIEAMSGTNEDHNKLIADNNDGYYPDNPNESRRHKKRKRK